MEVGKYYRDENKTTYFVATKKNTADLFYTAGFVKTIIDVTFYKDYIVFGRYERYVEIEETEYWAAVANAVTSIADLLEEDKENVQNTDSR